MKMTFTIEGPEVDTKAIGQVGAVLAKAFAGKEIHITPSKTVSRRVTEPAVAQPGQGLGSVPKINTTAFLRLPGESNGKQGRPTTFTPDGDAMLYTFFMGGHSYEEILRGVKAVSSKAISLQQVKNAIERVNAGPSEA